MARSATRGAHREIVSATRAGGVTLVIGAGISMPRGIPDWNSLAKTVWHRAFPEKPDPWSRQAGAASAGSPEEIPQLLPIIFELAFQKLGEPKFLELLRSELYKNAKAPIAEPLFGRSSESLAVIARLLVAEQKRGAGRRISGVITLNADDLLEQAVSRAAGYRNQVTAGGIISVVTRSTHQIVKPSMIPIYHVHGFLPSDRWKANSGHRRMLVFTDLQYWTTSATASAFANRIVSAALSEGRCIFIGVSMKDINLLRWLALRSLDRDRDHAELGHERLLARLAPPDADDPFDKPVDAETLRDLVETYLNDPAATQSGVLRKNFHRHFWIRPAATDPSGFLSRFLDECRGVRPVDIDDWRGTSFRRLMTKCFPRSRNRS